jgi:hypothetical protein
MRSTSDEVVASCSWRMITSRSGQCSARHGTGAEVPGAGHTVQRDCRHLGVMSPRQVPAGRRAASSACCMHHIDTLMQNGD